MFRMISPPFLKIGDKIGIVAPARKITENELKASFEIITKRGFEIIYSDNLFAVDNQFAGSDELRADDFQRMLEDITVKAVMFARGGYGSVRLIDKLDFSKFRDKPKWLIGYSDITVFHNHVVQKLGIQTLHASMPINFSENTYQSLDSLFEVISGKMPIYEIDSHLLNKTGSAEGILVGGNLSVLYSLLGSCSFPDMEGRILFLEDLDEYLYHIDRIMMGLKRANKLNNLAGLIIGGMTDMNDNTVPFGKTAEEIIKDNVNEYDYPICFGFPAGHITDNRAIIMGGNVRLEINEKNSKLIF